MTTESTLLKKVNNIANVLAGAGVGFTDYIIQLTYILFLKMDSEKEDYGLESTIPEGYKWKDLIKLSGPDLIEKYELDMRIIDASYTFDREQLIFRFVSDDRVDFRQLAKDL